jgi:hypothetical protein
MSDKISGPDRGPNRREALTATVGLAVAAGLANVPLLGAAATRAARAKHFIFAGDTLGYNAGPSPVFAKIAASIAAAEAEALFVLIAGDHVWDAPGKPAEMASRWQAWHAAAAPLGAMEVLHLTGNHTVYDEESAALYRAQFPHLPNNGPADGVGLSWWKRWDDVLLVGVNTAFNPLGKVCRVEHEWLDGVLREHRDARWKLVSGHHPVHPVNGFEHYNWRIWHADAQAFWKVLVAHRVDAYLCAHVIAFDAQVHDGIPQRQQWLRQQQRRVDRTAGQQAGGGVRRGSERGANGVVRPDAFAGADGCADPSAPRPGPGRRPVAARRPCGLVEHAAQRVQRHGSAPLARGVVDRPRLRDAVRARLPRPAGCVQE